MNRRNFNRALAASAALAAVPYVRAQSPKLKIGVILPKSGYLSFIGQSCQKGADLAPGVIRDMLGARAGGVDVGLEVGVHQLDVDAEHVLDHPGGEVGALLAGLADEAEVA